MADKSNDAISRRRMAKLSVTAAAILLIAPSLVPAQPNEQAAGATVKTVCVLGASGNVGNGIVRELLAAGHRVIAVSRSSSNLDAIRARFAASERLETLQGDVGSDEAGLALRAALMSRFGRIDAVVASLGSPEWNASMSVLEAPSAALEGAFRDNFFTHFIAAKSLLPALAPGGVYVGISGGLADFLLPGNGHLSMTQAAQRTLFQVLAQETEGMDVHVRLLGLYSMIATERNRDRAEPGWVTDAQVGQRIVEMITEPEAFPDTLQSLRSEQYR